MATTLTALKREVRVGQRVHVTNNAHPHLTGMRTVHKVQTNRLATTPDLGPSLPAHLLGEDGKPKAIWMDWPKAASCEVDGGVLRVFDSSWKGEGPIFVFDFAPEGES